MDGTIFLAKIIFYCTLLAVVSFVAGYLLRYFEEKHRSKMKRELLDELQRHKPTDSPE